MGTNRHADLFGVEVHTPYIQTFADDAARLADATEYDAADIDKKALQLDTLLEYVLTGVSPTVWTELPGAADGNNLGAQEEVFANKTGSTLNFRTIGPDNAFVQLTSDANEISIRPLHEYDAIVSEDVTEGTHTLLSSALASGAKSVFIKAGNYYEGDGITITDPDVLIQGEGMNDVNIWLEETGKITLDGSGRLESAGTIGVTVGSALITGSGTSFTNLTQGVDFIHIDGAPYPIQTITDNENMEIKPPYWGPTRSGVTNWWGGSKILGFQLYGVSIRDSVGDYALEANQIVNIRIRDTVFVEGGVNLQRCSEVNISSTVFTIQTGDALRIRDYCEGVRIEGVLVRTPQAAGIVVANNCQKVSIQGTSIYHAGDYGFVNDSSSYDITLNGVTAVYCDAPGFTLVGETVSATGCVATGNNGVGFSVESATLSGCIADSNTDHGFEVEAASVGANITGGKSINNSGTAYGVNIISGANSTIVSGNYLGNNAMGALNDNGTGTLKDISGNSLNRP